MRPLVLLVQATLVVVGLLVYDTLRSDRSSSGERNAPSPVPSPPDPARDSPHALSLRGRDSLMERIAALERVVRDSSGAEQSASHARRPELRTDTAPPKSPLPSGARHIGEEEFDPAEIRRFRRLIEASRRQEEEEKFGAVVRAELVELEVRCTPEERDRVVRETLAARRRVHRELPPMVGRDRGEAAREAFLREVEASYRAAVAAILPSSEVDLVVERLGRRAGLVPAPRPVPGTDVRKEDDEDRR